MPSTGIIPTYTPSMHYHTSYGVRNYTDIMLRMIVAQEFADFFCWRVQSHLLHVCQLTLSHTHHVENSKVKGCILDGEMVGWDAETEIFL